MSMGLVDFGSSESEFGTSVNSTMLAWTLELSPSGSWMSSYVSSANRVISIWNAIIEKIVRCLSIAFLHYKVVIQPIKQSTGRI